MICVMPIDKSWMGPDSIGLSKVGLDWIGLKYITFRTGPDCSFEHEWIFWKESLKEMRVTFLVIISALFPSFEGLSGAI